MGLDRRHVCRRVRSSSSSYTKGYWQSPSGGKEERGMDNLETVTEDPEEEQDLAGDLDREYEDAGIPLPFVGREEQ